MKNTAKRILSGVMSLAFILAAACENGCVTENILNRNIAEAASSDTREKFNLGYYTYCVEDGGVHILGIHLSRETEFTIPSELAGMPVTALEKNCVGISSLTQLYIPASVTAIDEDAFYYCTKLQTVYGVKGSSAETAVKNFKASHPIAKDITFKDINSLSDSQRREMEDRAFIPPVWVPENLSEAMEFEKTYGRTHMEDGYVCILFKKKNMTGFHGVVNNSPDARARDFAKISFDTEKEKSEESGYTGAFGGYTVMICKLNQGQYIKASDITDQSNQLHYNFTSDSGSKVTQNDCFSIVPDSEEEIKKELPERNSIKVYNLKDNIAVCYRADSEAGYIFEEKWSDSEAFSVVCNIDAAVPEHYDTAPPADKEVFRTIIYKPEKAAEVSAVWSLTPAESDAPVSSAKGQYEVHDDGTYSFSDEEKITASGDADGNGTVNTADIVKMINYLLIKDDTINETEADMNGDGTINVTDLCLLKAVMLQ